MKAGWSGLILAIIALLPLSLSAQPHGNVLGEIPTEDQLPMVGFVFQERVTLDLALVRVRLPWDAVSTCRSQGGPLPGHA